MPLKSEKFPYMTIIHQSELELTVLDFYWINGRNKVDAEERNFVMENDDIVDVLIVGGVLCDA